MIGVALILGLLVFGSIAIVLWGICAHHDEDEDW